MYNNTAFIAMKLLSKADLRRMVHEIYIEIKIDILKNRKLSLKIYWVVLIQTYFFFIMFIFCLCPTAIVIEQLLSFPCQTTF